MKAWMFLSLAHAFMSCCMVLRTPKAEGEVADSLMLFAQKKNMECQNIPMKWFGYSIHPMKNHHIPKKKGLFVDE